MKKTLLAALLIAISACAGLPAQTFSLITGREPVASLDGLWRFHTGDNPAWASPDFDDSQWTLLRSNEDWGKQGYLGLKGLAWYRFKVIVPGDSGPLSLLLPDILTNYEVYADGVRIGGCGEDYILVLLETLGGLVSLALFLFRRREREYLWFGCSMLLVAAAGALDIHRAQYGAEIRAFFRNRYGLDNLAQFAAVAFYFRLLRGRRSWLFYAALAGLALGTAANLLFSLPHARDYVRVPVINAVESLALLPFFAWTMDLLLRRAKDRLADARLLLAPVLLLYVNALVGSIIIVSFQFGWQHRIERQAFTVFSQPFPVSSNSLATFLYLIAMLAILVNRFARTRREEERYANEIEAARVVQQVLIPEAIPAVPGFAIENVYKPASEVGGDFFQILPTAGGGVLAAIGDVSGKGMPAAMTVSLLVGTVRTLAHYTQSPAEILAAMNQRMLGRSNGGFTTCLVLRADPDGTLTVANAGHLPPYRNGEELPVPSGLPLGLLAESSYEEKLFESAPGDRLTFISDGAVEARNSKGELLGFERMAGLTGNRAEEIAEAAQQWGQEDDITVLTVARAPKLEAIPA
jgi:sigma-B regulation protein RsbU (phosphoserine phosphatase)